jgi:AraC family transcriptional regulator of adaptative response/methylated-DNA-[protein]-cysteine methyltransferase
LRRSGKLHSKKRISNPASNNYNQNMLQKNKSYAYNIKVSEIFMTDERLFKSDARRWQAVKDRDSRAAGQFVYAVSTTGIYCRPGCSSRQPKKENVFFFNRHVEAEQAGYRPCKRCAPQLARQPDLTKEAITQACHIIEEAETPPSLEELATAVGFSPYHFHRLFKKSVGITPKQYADQVRLRRLRGNLQQDQTVTAAIFNAGYQSGSRFYESATASLGMTPKAYQKGGQGMAILYAIIESYLGWVLVAGTQKGICRIDFGQSPADLQTRLAESFPRAELRIADPGFEAVVNQVIAYIEAPSTALNLPLDVQGTAFQQRVWQALRGISAGTTASYIQIANQIGRPQAARAVAQACAANQLAVAIPCHRVVRSDGQLGGYRWGLERKKALLDLEAALTG